MKKVKGADKTGKILKIGADTGKTIDSIYYVPGYVVYTIYGKTLRRRKVLTKAVKKQITKHIRELNPTNVSVL